MQKLLIRNGYNAIHKLFTEFLQMPIDKIKSAKKVFPQTWQPLPYLRESLRIALFAIIDYILSK